MSSYDELKTVGICALDDRTKYMTAKFVCKACESTVFWRELSCKGCDKMIEWCTVKKENGSFIIKL